jgi:Ca-activated chloride channel family protein
MSFTRRINSKLTFVLVISAVALALAACSAPAEKLNQDGNEAFAEQAYLEALELYQSAQIESPELAEPYFNAANTFYRQGDFPAALEQMQMALQYVEEGTLAESSFYNMGNTLFNSQDLGTAVEAYKQALLLDPDDQDAKYNLELALQQQEQQQREQQQEQQQQQQEQEQQDEQNQDQGEESRDQSQEGQGEDQESQQNENEDPQNGENQDEESQDQEGDQSQNNDQQNGDQEPDQENGSEEPQGGDSQQSGDQPSQVPPPGQRMTEEQAQQLLAAIADDTQTLQEKLEQYLFARQAPPAQDW